MSGKALVLHSGGLDSTVALFLAIRDFGADNVISVGMNYGQIHQRELSQATRICEAAGVQRLERDIRGIFPAKGLADKDFKVPDCSYDEIKGVSPTYVPFRNGTMLSVLTALASALGADESVDPYVLYLGVHAEDAKNWAYPDCTPEFVGAMANAIYVGTYHKVRVAAPLVHMLKSDIVRVGAQLNVPFDLTWSCYKGEELHCGTCPTCRSRKGAFVDAGVIDPTLYQSAIHPDELGPHA